MLQAPIGRMMKQTIGISRCFFFFFGNYSKQHNEELLDSLLCSHIKVLHVLSLKELNIKPPDADHRVVYHSKKGGTSNALGLSPINAQLGEVANGLDESI